MSGDPRLLSNGRYRVLLADGGGGYSAWGDLALTRWSDDAVPWQQGLQLLVRDLERGKWWRVAAPHRHPEALSCKLEVAVAPDEDIEIRRLTLQNSSNRSVQLDITSYIEVALNHPAADAGHPAFSKLFVQTELVPPAMLLAGRRPRSPEEPPCWMGHALWLDPGGSPSVQLETDRARFIGRGRSLARPAALDPGAELSGTVGNVLDPILSLRFRVKLEPGNTANVIAVLAAGRDRGAIVSLLERCQRVPVEATLQNVAPVQVRAPPDGPDSSAEPFFHPAFERVNDRSRFSNDWRRDLQYFNGYGGFTPDGREYLIPLTWNDDSLQLPPLPWVNVVANPLCGFIASERGAGSTWSINSRENRLTPWSNDPVIDPHGEALYLRDEESRLYWSPFPGPLPGPGDYQVRHGFGYSVWNHRCLELEQEVVSFVPRHDSLKLTRLGVRNSGSQLRRLSLLVYVEWVLGGLRADTRKSIAITYDPDLDALFAVNPERGEFRDRVAFLALASSPAVTGSEFTTDRSVVLGPTGTLERPAAMTDATPLADRIGSGLDPCAAFRVWFSLEPGAKAEFTLLLGEAEDRAGAAALIRRYRHPGAVAEALQDIKQFWQDLVSRVQVTTPSPALDLMVNGWLTYQNLSCRMWGRSAFYQSGGAYGFRDQLQDASALIYATPELSRNQILLHAAHQFPEGDVLHWWHPPSSKGIRTRFSDDLLWLPHVVCDYIRHTGDVGLLDQAAGFLEGRQLRPGEDEAFLHPSPVPEPASVYQHCCRALDRSLTRGSHGLPLMGTGDWNDGMNRVGREGRGESVWLGFFLYHILDRFVLLCDRRGDGGRAERYRAYASALGMALNDTGWDGRWYRRAFYDDGAPLGSWASDECTIDAIAQAWAVISGVASAARAALALDAAETHLVDEGDGIIRLLTPPFDKTPHDPGYIKGYLPGVRENGGQYTHGALWLVRALAEAGRSERAARLLEMLSPISRSATPEAVARYRVEPYVIAADVYGEPPHIGRGGWTWYTGSAGWMFRVALESVLGLTVEGGKEIVLRPRIPIDWPGYEIRYRSPNSNTSYDIHVEQSRPRRPETRVHLDGKALPVRDGAVRVGLVRDQAEHQVRVWLGSDVAEVAAKEPTC